MNLPPADKTSYLCAHPFPHAVIDGAFDDDELRDMLATWPVTHEYYSRSGDRHEINKGATLSEGAMGPYITNFIRDNFLSQKFIYWLEDLSGIPGLVTDCRKFALHEIYPGGSLAPHLDYTIDKRTGLQLRINVLLYLTEAWRPEYGGNLELYEAIPAYGGVLNRCAVSIAPVFNRMVIFTMDADKPAWHRNPSAWNAPGVTRKAIACNYFTLPQPSAAAQRTRFAGQGKSLLKDWMPPILYKKIIKKAT